MATDRVYFTCDLPSSSSARSIGYVQLVNTVDLEKVLGLGLPEHSTATSGCTTLCLVNVPAQMIPTDLLQFFGPNLNLVSSIRIFRHAQYDNKYLAVLQLLSPEAISTLLDEYNGQMLSSLDNIVCTMLPARTISFESDNGTLSTQIPRNYTASTDTVLEGEEEAATCPVCLEPIYGDNPMSITTCCNHEFHMQCSMRLESVQCPVCRFCHDGDMGAASVCFECGTHARCNRPLDLASTSTASAALAAPQVDLWLCLICGYTGCGASHGGHIQQHYESTLHTYAQNTESRQVYDFAGDGYVHRLILGTTADSTEDGNSTVMDAGVSSTATDAIGGVHARSKLVESYRGQSLSGVRDPRAPLSSQQEEALVSGKLEAAARHYNQLLAWQLEQNRLLYQARLQRIRESVSAPTSSQSAGDVEVVVLSSSKTSVASLSKSSGGGKLANSGANWRGNMITTLRTEKSKVVKQLEGARERLERARKEVAVLRELNASLQQNQSEWQRRVDVAGAEHAGTVRTFQREIPKLEEKVRILMEKLDLGTKSETGARAASEATPDAGGGDAT